MARISLTRSIKFQRLLKVLPMNEAHARGHLEYLWESAHDSSGPTVGTQEIVELVAKWNGEPGVFAQALETVGFLERDEDNRLVIHDYWENCPDYVRLRRKREIDRQNTLYNREHPTSSDIVRQSRTKSDFSALPGSALPGPALPEESTLPSLPPTSSAAEPTTDLPASPPVREPITTQLATDAELERRFARYTIDPEADAADVKALRRVLLFVTSDRLTGKPLPPYRRLKILDTLTRFTTEVVFRACHSFAESKSIETGKDHRYLVGICEGSATSEAIEQRAEREKEAHHELREKPRDREPLAASNPQTIGAILSNMRHGEG